MAPRSDSTEAFSLMCRYSRSWMSILHAALTNDSSESSFLRGCRSAVPQRVMELLDAAETRKPNRWSRMHSCISVGRSLRLMLALVVAGCVIGWSGEAEEVGFRKRLVGQLILRNSVLRGSGCGNGVLLGRVGGTK